MPTTTNLGLPYPAPTATPDVPYDMQQLAESVDSNLAGTRPRCSLSISVNQSIAVSGTAQILTWDTEAFDVGAMHSAGVNPSRITATKAGLYLVTAAVEYANNATGYRRLQFKLNGATTNEALDANAVAGGFSTQLCISTLWQAALNDYIEVLATQTSTAALNVISGGATSFKALWMCP